MILIGMRRMFDETENVEYKTV